MTTTHPDPKTMQRLAEFVERCKRACEAKAPIPAPPQNATPPPKPWSDTDKEMP